MENMEDLREFYINFANLICIFDPLDRKIYNCDEDDDQTIKREDLVKRLQEIQPIKGSELKTPLSNEMYGKLEALLTAYEKKCYSIGKELVDEAKKTKKGCQIKNDEKIKTMLRAYEIFLQYDIITEAQILTKMNSLRSFVKD